jgi:hypothetical protein
MSEYWWVAPVLALVGALLGGMLSSWITNLLGERRAERALVRDARIALERWHATRVGPYPLAYPGVDPSMMTAVSEDALKTFFERHLQATFEAKAALGSIRHLDRKIAAALDVERWDLPTKDMEGLRSALVRAEKRAWQGKRDQTIDGALDVQG